MEESYLFWMVWCRTFEGDERWSMKRTPDTWDEDMVMERAKSNLGGGVGPDAAEILRVEVGWEDNVYDIYDDE